MRRLQFYILLHLTSLFSLRITHGIASFVGYIYYLIPNKHTSIANINLQKCFPQLSAKQRKSLLIANLQETAKTAFEMGPIWCWKKQRVLSLVTQVSGREHLQAALDKGKGVIIAAPHIGCWELLGLYLSSHYPMTSLYRPPKDPALEPTIKEVRERFGSNLVPTNARGVKSLYTALQNNHLVGVLPDQDPGRGSGEFRNFFGVPAKTMTLMARLAERTEASVLFCYAERLSKGKGYHIHLRLPPCSMTEDAILCTNQGVEMCVNDLPKQYQWTYKRFRSRPEGEAPLYP